MSALFSMSDGITTMFSRGLNRRKSNLEATSKFDGYHTELYTKRWIRLSSLAGLRPIVKAGKIKAFWTSIFVSFFSCSCVQLAWSCIHYQNQQPVTLLEVIHKPVPFPAVTVCNINAYRRKLAAKVPELAKLILAYAQAEQSLVSLGGVITSRKKRKADKMSTVEQRPTFVRSPKHRIKRQASAVDPPCGTFWSTTVGPATNYGPTNGPCSNAISLRPAGFCNYATGSIYAGDWTGDGICDLVCHNRLNGVGTRVLYRGLANGSFINQIIAEGSIDPNGCTKTSSGQMGYAFQTTIDGFTDFLCHDNTGRYWIASSNGYSGSPGGVTFAGYTGAVSASPMGTFCRISDGHSFDVGDANCDGTDDMRCYANGRYYIAISWPIDLNYPFPGEWLVQNCIDANGVWISEVSSCFIFNNINLTWNAAQNTCASSYSGTYTLGRLATFGDQLTWDAFIGNYSGVLPAKVWLGMKALCSHESWQLYWMHSVNQVAFRAGDVWPTSNTGWTGGMNPPLPATAAPIDCSYLRKSDSSIQFDYCTANMPFVCVQTWAGYAADLPASKCGSTRITCNTYYNPATTGPCQPYLDLTTPVYGFPSGWCSGTIYAGDFDNDSQCDIMCNAYPGPVKYIFGSNAVFGFDFARNKTGPTLKFCSSAQPGAAISADLNGDGFFDLICRNELTLGFDTLVNPGLDVYGLPAWTTIDTTYTMHYPTIYCPSPATFQLGYADCSDWIIDLRCVSADGSVSSVVPGQTGSPYGRFPTLIIACAVDYCLNGGQCNLTDGVPVCTCSIGFEGTRCEIDSFSCAASPCGQDNTCLDYSGGFTCVKDTDITTLASRLLYAGDSDLMDSLSLQAMTSDVVAYMVANINESILQEIGHPYEQMVEDCEFNGEKCKSDDFVFFSDPTYGNCYTFNGQSSKARDSTRAGATYGLNMLVSASTGDYMPYSVTAGLKLVIHAQDEVPFPDEGMNVQLGAVSSYHMQHVTLNRMNTPTSTCIKNGMQNNFYYPGSYSVKACQRSCEQNFVLKLCGCGNPRIPLPPGNDSMACTVGKRLCVNYATEQFANMVHQECGYCYPPCSSMVPKIAHSKSKLSKKNSACENSTDLSCDKKFNQQRAVLNIFFQKLSCMESREFYVYPWFQLLNDIGNAIGLWIGASAQSLIEIVMFISGIFKYLQLRFL